MTDLSEINLPIGNLEEGLETVGHLAKIMIELKEENARLKEQLNTNSKNSSFNHAERQLRPLVISKKLTFGTQSERGSCFIERIFSVVATCKQQKKMIMEALHQWASFRCPFTRGVNVYRAPLVEFSKRSMMKHGL